jgi:hypothetical protein
MIKPRRDNLCCSLERDLVHNPCVRGGSQLCLYENWILLSLSQDANVCFEFFGKLSFTPIPNPYTLR